MLLSSSPISLGITTRVLLYTLKYYLAKIYMYKTTIQAYIKTVPAIQYTDTVFISFILLH